MDTKELIAGIAVVIDDEFAAATDSEEDEGKQQDLIGQIVNWFETKWDLPFVRMTELPSTTLWPNLLRSASFVLLDWRLWGPGGDELKKATIDETKEFLRSARESLVPVFILTNEDPDEVTAELETLPNDVYDETATESNFVFVKRKNEFWKGTSVDVETLSDWVYGNASVYALKTWNKVMDSAKDELFRAMCQRSVNWPRVFWETYEKDGADPSASLTSLINDSLGGRMRVDAFEDEHLAGPDYKVPIEDLRGLIVEASFRAKERLPTDEVRCGDLFKRTGGKYWLNLRPDCDCIPRLGGDVGEIEVYCVEGKKMNPRQLHQRFNNGHFEERVSECIVFGIADDKKSILFSFSNLRVCKYSDVREQRVGRLLHPYVTRMQQRYALFTQRQALPRIPDAVVPAVEKRWQKLSGAERLVP